MASQQKGEEGGTGGRKGGGGGKRRAKRRKRGGEKEGRISTYPREFGRAGYLAGRGDEHRHKALQDKKLARPAPTMALDASASAAKKKLRLKLILAGARGAEQTILQGGHHAQ